MALLSIVVPAYNVEAYLGPCLDSLLDQTFADIELIGVDDRSPDRCGAILDEYAARDPRVRVVHLAENAGLGGARNAGLAEATGEYVWFVDSDDWVATDCLATIAKRLDAEKPDVLMLGHVKSRWDGSTGRDGYNWLLRRMPEEPFKAEDFPRIVYVFPSAWNKVIRRDLLTRLDIPFPKGYYEDIPVTFPLLLAAEKISVLNMTCVYYRQRRDSILRSGGERHMELVDQYRLVWERVLALGDVPDSLISELYLRMVRHLFYIIGSGRLGAHQQEYFTRAGALVRDTRPAGFATPDGVVGIRYRLLLSGSWPAAVILRRGWRVYKKVKQKARKAYRTTRRAGGRTKGWLRNRAVMAHYAVQRRRPLDDKLALYCANWGRGYTCNPKAIYEKARELAPEVRGVWAVRRESVDDMPAGVPYVVLDTPAFYSVLARAKYIVNNNNFGNEYVKRSGSVYVQTHHGTPLKRMGVDERALGQPAAEHRDALKLLMSRCDNWDLNISSNLYSTAVWRRAYPCSFTTLEYGYPRNDVLSTATPERIAQIRAGLGIAPDERVILYAPTHRDYQGRFNPFLDPSDLADRLGPGNRVLVRAHYFYNGVFKGHGPITSPYMQDVSTYPSVEELYLAADVLITDFSSTMFDYAVLDRPIVIYAPDWPVYQVTRGVYFDLAAEPPGLFASTADDLVNGLRSGAYDSAETTALRAAFRRRFAAIDDGHAAERVVRSVLLGEQVTAPNAIPTQASPPNGAPIDDAEEEAGADDAPVDERPMSEEERRADPVPETVTD
ncbi:bifunctional glycosyltransferase family 2 protein/CDP-glycerol:glycerophosphate glycerophosphotransferase [Actinocatenispora thailandica]|uniref:bifunctional glycosyltransferase/CDP-glycerol:glycerophosphate glycerophosphotransferase n=2 Tax=Actinocatenispora thailandica TaxID=227318 RepID=UPI0031D9CA75